MTNEEIQGLIKDVENEIEYYEIRSIQDPAGATLYTEMIKRAEQNLKFLKENEN